MRHPVTSATRLLDQMGVEPHAVIKTLVMVDDVGSPLIVLMHAEKEVSLRELARQTGTRNVSAASVRDVERLIGYSVGGISPFATRRPLPVYVQRTIEDLPYLYINGGRRGFILGMKPDTLTKVLSATPVDASL